MSLSKIGKTSALTGALSDLLNNKGTLKNVNDSLLSFGNIDIAAAALAKASVGTGLSDANLTAMLQSAYGGTESAANAAGLAMSNALSSVEVAAPEASAAVSGISGAFATTKAAAVGFLSVMKSILPIAAIIGGAFVAGKLAWDNILTNNTVDKNYKNSSDKYDNAKSELTSLQTQYDTNKERIQELNAKQYLSSEERAEKNKLERENQLLDSQVSTGKNVVSASQKQKALDAQKTLDKSSYHKNYQVRIAAKYIGYVEKSNIKNPNTPAATTTKKYPFVGKVTASKLNVRKKPGTEHPLLPEYPMLNKDNLINVLGVTKDTKGDRWYKVSITKKEYVGYVSAKYIIKA